MNGKRAPQQTETRLAALAFLHRALVAMSIPINLAEEWVRPADLVEFVEEVEAHVRRLMDFLNGYLEKCPEALRREGNRHFNGLFVSEVEINDARKNLALLDKLLAARSRAAMDFSAEAEELRKLRAGELEIDPPSDSNGAR